MRNLLLILVIGCCGWAWGQNPTLPPANSHPQDATRPPDKKQHNPDLSPPHSDRVNADALEPGESSSKDSQVDLSPPEDDAKAHPNGGSMLEDAGDPSANPDVSEFHPWNPHKAAKDVEVGDFYFKRKNYRAAEDRYREALLYKNNDALATFRLAVCLEKLDRPAEAREQYESYLKILPSGPEVQQAKKAIDRLKGNPAGTKAAK